MIRYLIVTASFPLVLLAGTWIPPDQPSPLTPVVFNPVYRDQLVVYDIGLPPGGGDVRLDADTDAAAIPLRRAIRQHDSLPQALGYGLQLEKPCRVYLTAISGTTALGRGTLPAAWWNDSALDPIGFANGAYLPDKGFAFSPTAPVSDTACPVVVAYDLPTAGEGILWFEPRGDSLAFVDDLRVDGDCRPLTAGDTRGLFGRFGPYESRSLRGRGQALVADFYRGYPDSIEYAVCRPLQLDADYLGYQQAWFPVEQWNDARLVILNTRHLLTADDSQRILDWVAGGGTLIVTPGTLQWFLIDNADMAPAMARWAGGYTGHWQKLPDGELSYRLAPEPPTLTALATFGDAPLTRPGDLEAFLPPDTAAPGEIALMVTHSSARFERVAMYFHPIGEGRVIGLVGSFHPRLVRLWRELVVDCLTSDLE